MEEEQILYGPVCPLTTHRTLNERINLSFVITGEPSFCQTELPAGPLLCGSPPPSLRHSSGTFSSGKFLFLFFYLALSHLSAFLNVFPELNGQLSVFI